MLSLVILVEFILVHSIQINSFHIKKECTSLAKQMINVVSACGEVEMSKNFE